VGVEVGGPAQNLTFQMVPIPIFSVLTCSTISSHDILKVKKNNQYLPCGWDEHDDCVPVGISF